MPARPVIQVAHLRKRYGATLSVDDVSFGVPEDEIIWGRLLIQ